MALVQFRLDVIDPNGVTVRSPWSRAGRGGAVNLLLTGSLADLWGFKGLRDRIYWLRRRRRWRECRPCVPPGRRTQELFRVYDGISLVIGWEDTNPCFASHAIISDRSSDYGVAQRTHCGIRCSGQSER